MAARSLSSRDMRFSAAVKLPCDKGDGRAGRGVFDEEADEGVEDVVEGEGEESEENVGEGEREVEKTGSI